MGTYNHKTYVARRKRAEKAAQAEPAKAWAIMHKTCTDAVRVWEAVGYWPDDWSDWERALQDAALTAGVRQFVSLDSLV